VEEGIRDRGEETRGARCSRERNTGNARCPQTGLGWLFAAISCYTDLLNHAQAAKKIGNGDPEVQKMLEIRKKFV
jgi:hypothetical protein